MGQTAELVRGIVVLVLGIGGALAFIVWTIVRAEDPARRLFKWILTAPAIAFAVFVLGPLVGRGDHAAAFVGIPATAVWGLFLAIVWRHDLAALIARPFSDLYDGGNVPPEPRPLYSVAMAKQKRGEYLEAIAEIRQQLARFPADVEGQFLLAQIQAENLKDLDSAELTIQHFCSQQPPHAPRNIAFALYSMADWYLQIGKDPDNARRVLEQLVQALPGSEFALGAAQRIAHLSSPDRLMDLDDPRIIPLPHTDQRLGLKLASGKEEPARDAVEIAAEYVRHLEAHPLDTEAREKLAVHYADHMARLDLAIGELEQLIACPNQPARLIVHWLNILTDLQVRAGGTYEDARATLQRIIDLYPGLAAAENAAKRLNLLKLEFKGKEKSQAVKLGSYEQNIGLKRGLPHKF